MAHRSISPSEASADPFWADARLDEPRLTDRLPRPPSWWAAALVVGLLVLGAGWWLLRPAAAPIESSLPMAGAGAASAEPSSGGIASTSALGASTTTSSTVPEVVAQVSGRVKDPGVYHLPAGARVDDIVRAAGGFGEGADRDRVNLAAPVGDGERVWIPAQGEDDPPELVAGSGGGSAPAATSGASSGGSSAGGAGSTAPTPAAPIDLNSATAEDLDALPGVGPATATAILSYRDQSGPFRSVDDLLEVRGIGDAKLEQIRPLVRVG